MRHEMNLSTKPFDMIKDGRKTIELRLYDEKRREISVGDEIGFTRTDGDERLIAKVEELYFFDSFEELYRSLDLTKCGYTEENVYKASPSDMEKYYSKEKQRKYGVVGIKISLI